MVPLGMAEGSSNKVLRKVKLGSLRLGFLVEYGVEQFKTLISITFKMIIIIKLFT